MFFRVLHKIEGRKCFPILHSKASIAIIKPGKDSTDKNPQTHGRVLDEHGSNASLHLQPESNKTLVTLGPGETDGSGRQKLATQI